MTKITIINGSPRKNGATGKILQAFRKQLEEKENVEIHYIDLVDYQLQNCVGCEICYKTGICHLKDKAEEINKLVAHSQGVMIGSPNYAINVSAFLKNYIDRGHIVFEQALKDKYMFTVVTYENYGGATVVRMLNSMFRHAGGAITGKFLLKLNHNSNPFEQDKILKEINRKADQFYYAITQRKHKNLFDRLINYFALHIGIKPFVLRNSLRFKAVVQRWKEIKVIS
ncbi:MAG: flavodoxin family protein [Lentimicrobiaceae bacterium]|nr:flavodoxin family protein [Lentimicrobiaceae bacterium]